MRSVLSIAGSDSSGGAGIQADIKTIEANQLFATTAITAITVQNTCGVHDIENISPGIITGQVDAVFDDIRPDAVKIGMVSVVPAIKAIGDALRANDADHIVLDPVMVATSGSKLIDDDAIDALISCLFPIAQVITPNIPEAEILSGMRIMCEDDMVQAARMIAEKSSGCRCEGVYDKLAVLVKGGHGIGSPDSSNDFLLDNDGQEIWLYGKRVDNPNSHGTGCTLSSAIACGLAKGQGTETACRNAKAYVTGALRYGLDLGSCSGPMNHMWDYMEMPVG